MIYRSIFRKIAKENKITIAKVKEDMQLAIEFAYKNPKWWYYISFQDKVPCKWEVPTPDEFIKYVTQVMKDSN